MKTALAFAILSITLDAASAQDQCTASDVQTDTFWSTAICGGKPRDKLPEAPVMRSVELPAPTKRSVGVDVWRNNIETSYRLIMKSLDIGDAEELKRQSYALAKRSGEVLNWPEENAWSAARVHCSRMATTLMNFADYKLQISARGELNAESALKDYREAGRACTRGLAKVK